MISPITSDSNNEYLSTLAVSSESGKTTDSQTEKTASGTQTSRTDSVEISEQARAAMEQSTSVATTQSTTEASSAAEQAEKKAAASASSTDSKTAATSSSSSSSYTDLSSLTKAQMDKLVSQGTITQQQETAELAKRDSEKAQQSSASSESQGIKAYQAQQQSTAQTTENSTLDIVA